MSEQEFLIAIAELSIALIAFTNIVVALKQMGGGCLTDFQVLVVRLFSVCGFCAIFFALLPILLSYFGVGDEWIWRISNLLLAASLLSINSWYFRHRRRVAPDRPLNVANYLTSLILYTSLLALAAGTLGINLGRPIAPIAYALVGLLVASAVAFLNTLADFLVTPAPPVATADSQNKPAEVTRRAAWPRPLASRFRQAQNPPPLRLVRSPRSPRPWRASNR